MSKKQIKLENSAGVTTAITNSNRALIGAALVSLGSSGTPSQQLTDSGHELTAGATGAANIDRWDGNASSDQYAWDWIGTYRGVGTNQAFTATGVLYLGRSSSSDSGTTNPWKARFPASGNMAWQDNAGVTIPLTSGAHAPVAGTKYRYSVVANRAAGSITIKAYSLAGTLLATWSKASGADLGTDPFIGMRGDAPNNQAGTTVIQRLQMDDGATAEIGPWVDAANAAPTAAYDSVRSSAAAGATATATLTGTDTDGTIAGYEHTLDSFSIAGATLGGATSQQASLVLPNAPGNVFVLKGRVKDDQNAFSAYVYKEICIPTGDSVVYPLPVTSGGYLRNGSQATDGAALSTVDDADYLQSPVDLSSTAQTLRVRVRPMVTRSGTLAVVVRLSRAGTSAHAVCRLYQGSTLMGTLASFSVTDTPTDYELDLTASQVDTITAASGWLNLFVEIDGLI